MGRTATRNSVATEVQKEIAFTISKAAQGTVLCQWLPSPSAQQKLCLHVEEQTPVLKGLLQ